MSSRDRILQRIRAQMQSLAGPEPPPIPRVWPPLGLSKEQLTERFCTELSAVSGEVIRCPSQQQAVREFYHLYHQLNWSQIGMFDRPECCEVAREVPVDGLILDSQIRGPEQIATLSAGLVTADFLLADTGSVVIDCQTKVQRLLCYLPPICVFVARVGQIAEHMPAVWGDLTRCIAEKERRGELVFITGPSRTADIEKVLILGVHGPKRVIGLLIQD